MLKVFNKRRPSEIPSGAVYVGRPSQWGNPFSKSGRDKNIEDFREYAEKRIQREPSWLNPLKGKSLICWCSPQPCHADILIEMANKPVCTKPEVDWDAWCRENEPSPDEFTLIPPSDWEVQNGLG